MTPSSATLVGGIFLTLEVSSHFKGIWGKLAGLCYVLALAVVNHWVYLKLTFFTLDMPPPQKIELPDFSPNTIMLLNQKHEKAEKAVLRECSEYYHAKYPELKSSDYYQSIGKQLVTKFPFLAYEGKTPWVSVLALLTHATGLPITVPILTRNQS